MKLPLELADATPTQLAAMTDDEILTRLEQVYDDREVRLEVLATLRAPKDHPRPI